MLSLKTQGKPTSSPFHRWGKELVSKSFAESSLSPSHLLTSEVTCHPGISCDGTSPFSSSSRWWTRRSWEQCLPFHLLNSVPCCLAGKNENLVIICLTLTGKLYVIQIMQKMIPSDSFLLTWKPSLQVFFTEGSALNSGINNDHRSHAPWKWAMHTATLGSEDKGCWQMSYQRLSASQENCEGCDRGTCHRPAEIWWHSKHTCWGQL